MSWDICPDHLTPEAMLILQETLNIHSIKDFLTANPQKVAAASLLKVDQVQQIKEIIYKRHCVHVLNCGELVLDPKSRNSSCVRLDLPELVKKIPNVPIWLLINLFNIIFTRKPFPVSPLLCSNPAKLSNCLGVQGQGKRNFLYFCL